MSEEKKPKDISKIIRFCDKEVTAFGKKTTVYDILSSLSEEEMTAAFENLYEMLLQEGRLK